MAYKSQTVAQYEGFGNDKPTLSEHYFSKGFTRSGNGIAVGRCFTNFYSTTEYSSLTSVTRMLRGRGRALSNDVENSYTFFGDSGNNVIHQSYLGVTTPEAIYRVMGQSWFGSGMAVDQSRRLLYSGWQYLGKHDPTIANYQTGTVSVTNGSAAVVGTGTTFIAGDVGKVFRIIAETGTTSFYKISAFTDATHITLASNYVGTTGSGKTYTIYRGWDDIWKDWGTSITGMADGSSFIQPSERYEDTVLFGRRNNIVTLNTLTDTITTDASPAFSMPSGYDNRAIVANTNGILMGFTFEGKGVLVLWDNYSDRSIAPWIPLDDDLLGIQRYGSGWIVMTARGIFFTNGYSIEPFLMDFLETSISKIGGVTQAAFIIVGDHLLFGLSASSTKLRAGLYDMNLKTKRFEHLGTFSDDVYNGSISALLYSPDFNRVYVSFGNRVCSLSEGSILSTRTYYYVSEQLGIGENPKIAEAIRLPVQISKYSSSKRDLTFTLEVRVNNLDRQMHNLSQAASNGSTTTLVVDETTWPPAQAGDFVEFLTGSNKGLFRGITEITGGGTATATYTLDSALPNATATSDNFSWSGFKPVEKKVVTATSELFDLYYGVKNKYRGKHFRVMFIVTGATTPLVFLPFEFQYDDMGALE